MPNRRRVKKIWAPEDVAGTLTVPLPGEDAPRPDWAAVFGRVAPLHLEVGFGKGDFAMTLAGEHPELNVVAVEIKKHLVHWVEAKAVRRGITNLRLVCCDARWQLGRLFAPGALGGLYYNFSDPWPKERHAKRRLLHPGLAGSVATFLAPGGVLSVVTDVRERCADAHAGLAGSPYFEDMRPGVDWTVRLEDYPETIHERKFRDAGRSIHHLRFRRTETPTP